MDSRLLTREEKIQLEIDPKWTVKEIKVGSKTYYYLRGPYKHHRWTGGFGSLEEVRDYIDNRPVGEALLRLGLPFEVVEKEKCRGVMDPFLGRIVFPKSERGAVVLAHEIGHFKGYREHPEEYIAGWLPKSGYHEASEKEAWEFAISRRLPKGMWGQEERQIAQESLESHLGKRKRGEILDWLEKTEEKFK